MDIKRVLMDRRIAKELNTTSVEVDLSIDRMAINLGQKDFRTLYFTWADNVRNLINYFRKS